MSMFMYVCSQQAHTHARAHTDTHTLGECLKKLGFVIGVHRVC